MPFEKHSPIFSTFKYIGNLEANYSSTCSGRKHGELPLVYFISTFTNLSAYVQSQLNESRIQARCDMCKEWDCETKDINSAMTKKAYGESDM